VKQFCTSEPQVSIKTGAQKCFSEIILAAIIDVWVVC